MGELLTSWTARLAFLLYAAALAAWLTARPRAARLIWTSGLLVYLSHVATAFHFHHDWSHAAAYEETARQTAALFGVRSGGGLYWNYTFTAVWMLDVLWMWIGRETHRRRPVWLAAGIHGFMAFLFFNATVVFGSWWIRWVGVAGFAGLGILAWGRRRGTGAAS